MTCPTLPEILEGIESDGDRWRSHLEECLNCGRWLQLIKIVDLALGDGRTPPGEHGTGHHGNATCGR